MREARARELLALVHLEHVEARKPRQLSGGQQQRVALARALAKGPTVLLLDEPLGALDLKLRKEMQVFLKRLHREIGLTFVYVTHDQEEALAMSDRVAVMNQGRIDQLATPREIYDSPATRFVADFIGETNFIKGHRLRRRRAPRADPRRPGRRRARGRGRCGDDHRPDDPMPREDRQRTGGTRSTAEERRQRGK